MTGSSTLLLEPLTAGSSMRTAFEESALARWVRLLPLVGLLGYWALLHDAGSSEWLCVIGACLGMNFIAGLLERNRKASVAQALNASLILPEKPRGSEPVDPARVVAETRLSESWKALQALPVMCGRLRLGAILSLSVSVPVSMAMVGFAGWLDGYSIVNWMLAVLTGATMAATFSFYETKNQIRDLAQGLRIQEADLPSVRRGEYRAPLAQSMQLGVFVPAALALILMLNLVAAERNATAEDVAIEWSAASLSTIADGPDTEPIRDRIDRQKRAQQGWPIAVEIVEVSTSRVGSEELLRIPEALLARLDLELGRKAAHGQVRIDGIDQIGAYHRLDEDSTLFAYVSRSALQSLRGGYAIYAETILLVGVLAVLCGIGVLMRRDLARALDLARESAESLAAGDLGPAGPLE